MSNIFPNFAVSKKQYNYGNRHIERINYRVGCRTA